MRSILCIIVIFFSAIAFAQGNTSLDSYSDAKRLLYCEVYRGHRFTVYCGAAFDADRHVTLPEGFVIPEYHDRAYRAETEHIVAAENFGRAFAEWREGAPQCVDSDGRRFKGRKCAGTNREYRLMESDLHNLAPAIGAVNAMRRNYRFGVLPTTAPSFGSCPMKVSGGVAEPPDQAKGLIARTHLYMADAYGSRYRLSRSQRQLFEVWNTRYPPDEWECRRERRIARIQGNHNNFTYKLCPKAD